MQHFERWFVNMQFLFICSRLERYADGVAFAAMACAALMQG